MHHVQCVMDLRFNGIITLVTLELNRRMLLPRRPLLTMLAHSTNDVKLIKLQELWLYVNTRSCLLFPFLGEQNSRQGVCAVLPVERRTAFWSGCAVPRLFTVAEDARQSRYVT
jgi:hypothetical protein